MIAPEHGKEKARYIKPGQSIHIFTDGCLVVQIQYAKGGVLVYVMTEDRELFPGHTHPDFCDNADIRKGLMRSGYTEEDPLFWL